VNIDSIIKKIESNPTRNFGIVFWGLIIYQFLHIFQGFELCDSGFYATFYQNVFSDPTTVEYNFLFWFTGIIGGLFVKIFPDSGLLGLRLLGVLNISAIIYLVNKLLKRHINNNALLLGLIIVTVSFIDMPTEFYHNNLSSFLFILASYFLYKGLELNKALLFILCGIFLALNLFTRLPNILDIGIISIIILHAFYYREKKTICLRRILILVSSFAASIVGILIVMKILGHYEIFVTTLKGLGDVTKGKTENTHSLFAMIQMNLNCYKDVIFSGLFMTLIIVSLTFFFCLFIFFTSGKYNWVALLIIFFVFVHLIRKFSIINLLYYVSIISLFWNIYSKAVPIKILSWIGLFMLIVLPLGSDGSIWNLGNYSVWIAVPLAVNLFMTEKFVVKIAVDNPSFKKLLSIQIDNHHLKIVLLLFLISFISRVFYLGMTTAYYDPGSRIHKTYRINNVKAKCIYTTQERATVVNNLLEGIKPFIKDGDYLIAYESIPMIYYLTNTKPFLHDSWLVGMDSTSFTKKIKRSRIEDNPLPLVLRQKFETIGYFGVPSDDYISDNRKSTIYVSQEQTIFFNKFLLENNYHVVWENSHFILYEPKKDMQ
jgi:hypothetical protein